jgi:hypothetical protein
MGLYLNFIRVLALADDGEEAELGAEEHEIFWYDG